MRKVRLIVEVEVRDNPHVASTGEWVRERVAATLNQPCVVHGGGKDQGFSVRLLTEGVVQRFIGIGGASEDGSVA